MAPGGRRAPKISTFTALPRVVLGPRARPRRVSQSRTAGTSQNDSSGAARGFADGDARSPRAVRPPRAPRAPPCRSPRVMVAMPPRRSPAPLAARRPKKVFRVAVGAPRQRARRRGSRSTRSCGTTTSGTLAPGDEGGHSETASRVCRAPRSSGDVGRRAPPPRRGARVRARALARLLPPRPGPHRAPRAAPRRVRDADRSGRRSFGVRVGRLRPRPPAAHVVAAVTLESLGSIVLSDPDLAASRGALRDQPRVGVPQRKVEGTRSGARASPSPRACASKRRKNLPPRSSPPRATRSCGALTAAVFARHDFVTGDDLVPSLSEASFASAAGGNRQRGRGASRRTRGVATPRFARFVSSRFWRGASSRCTAPTVATQWFGLREVLTPGRTSRRCRPVVRGLAGPEHLRARPERVLERRVFAVLRGEAGAQLSPRRPRGATSVVERNAATGGEGDGEARGGRKPRTTGKALPAPAAVPAAQPYIFMLLSDGVGGQGPQLRRWLRELVRRAGAVLVRGGGGAGGADREAVRRRVQLGVRGRASAHAPDVLPVDVMALTRCGGGRRRGRGDGEARHGRVQL